jgi:hypothetical protein
MFFECQQFQIKLCLAFERNTFVRLKIPSYPWVVSFQRVLGRPVDNYASFRVLKTVCSPNHNIHVLSFMNSLDTALYCHVNEANHFAVYFVTILFKKLIFPLYRT